MNITYGIATKENIDELIQLRIAYMVDDFGSVSDEERAGMEKQLPDYFERKLGTELVAFIAKDDELGRKLQDLNLLTRKRAPKTKKNHEE